MEWTLVTWPGRFSRRDRSPLSQREYSFRSPSIAWRKRLNEVTIFDVADGWTVTSTKHSSQILLAGASRCGIANGPMSSSSLASSDDRVKIQSPALHRAKKSSQPKEYSKDDQPSPDGFWSTGSGKSRIVGLRP